MSRKVKHKFFSHGKNYPKKNTKFTPIKGEPNTYLDTYRIENGTFHSRRYFDEAGYAYKDLDVADHKHHKDHAHNYVGTHRQKPRELNKKEKGAINKAKIKRRFFK